MDRRLHEGCIRADSAGREPVPRALEAPSQDLRDGVRRRPESPRCAQRACRRERAVGDVSEDENPRLREADRFSESAPQGPLGDVLQRPAACVAPNAVFRPELGREEAKDLRDGPTHEHIVAETRMCMSLITRAAKALPKTSRRALRWG